MVQNSVSHIQTTTQQLKKALFNDRGYENAELFASLFLAYSL